MAEVKTDQNHIPTIAGLLNTDGYTITPLQASVAGVLAVSDNTTGSDNGGDRTIRDANGNPCMVAVSETDGATPVALYADSSGNLLIDST